MKEKKLADWKVVFQARALLSQNQIVFSNPSSIMLMFSVIS